MSPPRPLSVVLIGAGAMAHNHARVLSSLPSTRLDLIVDTDGERAAKLAAEAGCGSACELGPGAWDAAIIATPPQTHAELAVEVLSRGIPVLVEKPMAVDLTDVHLILGAAARLRIPLTCGFVERFNPVVSAALSVLDEPPVHIVGMRHSPPSLRAATSSVVHDLLIHDIDLAMVLNPGRALQRACGSTWTAPTGVVEIADALLSFEGSMLATLSASRAGQRKVRHMSVMTTSKLIELDLLRQDLTVYQHIDFPWGDTGPDYRTRTVIDIPFVRHTGEPLALEIEHFVALARGELDMEAERSTLLAPHVAAASVAA
jgi:predicted dehydrogenase